jgi:hypothetical protein
MPGGAEPAFSSARAATLANVAASPIGELPHWPYAVSSDGQGFLVNERIGAAPSVTSHGGDTIAVVVNWPVLLER